MFIHTVILVALARRQGATKSDGKNGIITSY